MRNSSLIKGQDNLQNALFSMGIMRIFYDIVTTENLKRRLRYKIIFHNSKLEMSSSFT
jgi:hypothetical protein